jgi:radical SAM superfamily enzyme YgiQ (UPF0313 family)
MRPPDAAIVTPPLCALELPQLGPPTLQGFAASRGVEVEHLDLNVAFRRHLRDKIELEVLDNPGGQQSPRPVLETLLLYFTDRFVARLGALPSYAASHLGWSATGACIEQLNPEAGSGLGYGGVVNAPPAILARFVRDRTLNYYHQYLDESRQAEAMAERYPLVGFSLMAPTQVVAALTLAARLKELRPELPIVLGGPWVSLFAAELAAAEPLRPFFDVVVEGEGELPFLELMRTGEPARWSDIPNAWIKRGGDLPRPKRSFVADLAELATPSYDGLDLDAYAAPRPVLLQSSRGCYWGRCAFCVHTFQAHAAETPRVRLRPLELVAADIEQLVSRYAPRYLAFGDVSISPARMKQLCQLMLERHLELPWFAFVRLDRGFDRALLEAMRRAGCLKLNFGLESGSARILGLLEKGHELDTARRIIDDALDLGFRVTLHTMAALPSETRADFEQTLELIEHYAPRVHETGTEVFRLERGTRIFQSPHSYQIEIRDAGKSFDNSIPFENLHGLGQSEAMTLLNERLYGFYQGRDDLIYRAKSNVGLRHKDDFATPSRFRARCRLRLGSVDFDEQVTVSTGGGGILTKLAASEEPGRA